MSIEKNKNVVARFWQAFSTGEYETCLSLLDDNEFTWWILGEKKQFPLAGNMNKKEFEQLLLGVSGNTLDSLTMTPSGWTAEGDRVAMEAESYAKMSNGKTYNNFYHFLHIVRDGKICMVKEYLDTHHAADVLCT